MGLGKTTTALGLIVVNRLLHLAHGEVDLAREKEDWSQHLKKRSLLQRLRAGCETRHPERKMRWITEMESIIETYNNN